jgi:hypothetical protein
VAARRMTHRQPRILGALNALTGQVDSLDH